MLKVAVIGSCMSNLTVAFAPPEFKFYQTHCIHHNRSDAFLRYFVTGSAEMIPEDDLAAMLQYKPETEKDARHIMRNQYPQHGGYFTIEDRRKSPTTTFVSDLASEPCDIILLDNYMDVAAKLMYHTKNPAYSDSPIFINPGFFHNESEINGVFHWWGDFLTPAQSAANWALIYRWLRRLQPNAKIMFLCYHSCSSTGEAGRFGRISGFYPELKKAIAGDDLIIVPPFEVDASLTKGPIDWPHFQPHFYKAIAGLVYLLASTDLKYTDGFSHASLPLALAGAA